MVSLFLKDFDAACKAVARFRSAIPAGDVSPKPVHLKSARYTKDEQMIKFLIFDSQRITSVSTIPTLPA
jgi:hypothetical protein